MVADDSCVASDINLIPILVLVRAREHDGSLLFFGIEASS